LYDWEKKMIKSQMINVEWFFDKVSLKTRRQWYESIDEIDLTHSDWLDLGV
jgi:hypothetical protein